MSRIRSRDRKITIQSITIYDLIFNYLQSNLTHALIILGNFVTFFFFLFFCFLCADKLTSNAALDPTGLVAIAIAHGFALFVAVAIGANISGGHVNPAVTFGLALGGQITILTGIFYWIAQLLGAIVAAFILKFVTGGLVRYCSTCQSKINTTFSFTHRIVHGMTALST